MSNLGIHVIFGKKYKFCLCYEDTADTGMRVCRGLDAKRDMFIKVAVGLLVMLLSLSWRCEATELMFELPDRDRQCFYEEIEKGVSCTLEYQVRKTKQSVFLIKAHHT